MNYVKNRESKKGYDYKKYMFGSENKTITFGKNGKDNDVYIYDATGKVFYAKGFYIDGGVYYSDVLSEDGPVISVTKVYNEASNVVDMIIGVMPVNEGDEVTVRVNNSMGLDEKDEYIYDYTATSNDTYIITAEEGEVTSIKRVKVSEITEGEYNIVYHYQDGTTPDETIKKKGSTPVRLKAIKREGYVHVGWAKTASATTPEYAPGSLFAENADTDLYAIWEMGEAREFTITFNANGGSVGTNTKTVYYDEAYGDLPTATRTGYTFAGWYTSSTGGTNITKTSTVTNSNAHTLYAHWTANQYKVTLNANGGSVSTSTITVTYDSTYGTLPNPSRSNYDFSGWYTATSGGTQVTPSTVVKITANQTLYAHWVAKYDCKCSNCTNKVSTYNSYCSTCSSYSKCSSSGSCTRHCTSTHYCKCNGCSSTVSCNTSQCSTCDSYSECTSCYNCGYHYSICSDCGYCSSCGCRCSSGGDSGGDSGGGSSGGSTLCSSCGGSGKEGYSCSGYTGITTCSFCNGVGMLPGVLVCPTCRGTGYSEVGPCEHGETSRHFVETGICTACNGTGLKSN